jgi:hypothetical protein
MNFEELSITVRERSLPELFDLALQLCRRHALNLTLLAIAGAAPWIALDWLVLTGTPDDSWLPLSWLVVLLVTQAPMATAPITAYLGEAMFSRRPTVRGALTSAARRWWQLLLLGLARGAGPALAVLLFSGVGDGLPGLLLLFLLMFHPAHAVEVVLLERQSLRASMRRANQLMASWRSEAVSHLAVGAVVVTMGCLIAAHAGAEVINLLFWKWLEGGDWRLWFHPGLNLLPALLPWPFIAYLAVVRFLAYIDLRTRREGWEIELDLRRAGRRLEPVGE